MWCAHRRPIDRYHQRIGRIDVAERMLCDDHSGPKPLSAVLPPPFDYSQMTYYLGFLGNPRQQPSINKNNINKDGSTNATSMKHQHTAFVQNFNTRKFDLTAFPTTAAKNDYVDQRDH